MTEEEIETKPCAICGDNYYIPEMFFGVCQDCCDSCDSFDELLDKVIDGGVEDK